MPDRTTADRWSAASQLFHWVSVALIAWIAYLGLTMVDMRTTPAKIEVYALHKSLGLTLLAVVALRLAWRLVGGAPKPLETTPRWQARVAAATHAALYVLLFAMPLSGWLFNSTSGYPLQWFGRLNLPALHARDEALADVAHAVHVYGFWLLLALVVLHAGAAFMHHVFHGDDTLRRMLPRFSRGGGR
jgi:cytochrome b561